MKDDMVRLLPFFEAFGIIDNNVSLFRVKIVARATYSNVYINDLPRMYSIVSGLAKGIAGHGWWGVVTGFEDFRVSTSGHHMLDMSQFKGGVYGS